MSGNRTLERKPNLDLLQCKVLVHRAKGLFSLARGGHPSLPPTAGIGGPANHTHVHVRNCTQVEARPSVNIYDRSAVGAVGIAYETGGV